MKRKAETAPTADTNGPILGVSGALPPPPKRATPPSTSDIMNFAPIWEVFNWAIRMNVDTPEFPPLFFLAARVYAKAWADTGGNHVTLESLLPGRILTILRVLMRRDAILYFKQHDVRVTLETHSPAACKCPTIVWKVHMPKESNAEKGIWTMHTGFCGTADYQYGVYFRKREIEVTRLEPSLEGDFTVLDTRILGQKSENYRLPRKQRALPEDMCGRQPPEYAKDLLDIMFRARGQPVLLNLQKLQRHAEFIDKIRSDLRTKNTPDPARDANKHLCSMLLWCLVHGEVILDHDFTGSKGFRYAKTPTCPAINFQHKGYFRPGAARACNRALCVMTPGLLLVNDVRQCTLALGRRLSSGTRHDGYPVVAVSEMYVHLYPWHATVVDLALHFLCHHGFVQPWIPDDYSPTAAAESDDLVHPMDTDDRQWVICDRSMRQVDGSTYAADDTSVTMPAFCHQRPPGVR